MLLITHEKKRLTEEIKKKKTFSAVGFPQFQTHQYCTRDIYPHTHDWRIVPK